MRRPILRLVLDTNVWLDWLVFDDPSLVRADFLVTKDRALLELRRGGSVPFRIVTPDAAA